MTAPTPDNAAPSAVSAFLRGVERRAAVFAELQGGDAIRGDEALAAAMRAFRAGAAQSPVVDWPRRFWTLLLASPLLRELSATPLWTPDLHGLGRIGAGPRAALLLRLAGGLGEADAAAVLGVARPTYRMALHHALPHTAEGTPDPTAWASLGEAVQHAVRNLPAERLAHLARLREDAIAGRRTPRVPVAPRIDPDPASTQASRWQRPALLAVAVAVVAAIAASFLWPSHAPEAPGDPRVSVEPLPAADAPVATYDATLALLTERDFAQLASASDDAFLQDLDFYAWYAAQRAGAVDEAALRVPADAGEQTRDDEPGLETSDAPL